MQVSSIPNKFAIPFASGAGAGYVRPIPTASQIGITAGAASLTDGFPPVTFLSVLAGGVPPSGQDFNGILLQATQWLQWMQAGGTVFFDPAFATEIGGYPLGARIRSSTNLYDWVSQVDNNGGNPDTGAPNWLQIAFTTAAGVTSFNGRANAVSLQNTDVTGALGYLPTPYFVNSQASSGNGTGYVIFPAPAGQPELIIAWSQIQINGTATTSGTIALPVTFPNNIFRVVTSDGGSGELSYGAVCPDLSHIVINCPGYYCGTGSIIAKGNSTCQFLVIGD